MSERQLTLIDVDENPFVVRLKEDRIQLVVIDSRPELEASELRAFAAVLYAAYCARPVIDRLDAARDRLSALRDKLALAGGNPPPGSTSRSGSDEIVGALDGAICAIADVKHDIVAPWAAIAPYPEPPRSAGRRAIAATSSRLP
jgi:hypothetical protein